MRYSFFAENFCEKRIIRWLLKNKLHQHCICIEINWFAANILRCENTLPACWLCWTRWCFEHTASNRSVTCMANTQQNSIGYYLGISSGENGKLLMHRILEMQTVEIIVCFFFRYNLYYVILFFYFHRRNFLAKLSISCI